MKSYEFTIRIVGDGDSIDEAWLAACEAFSLDYGELPENPDDIKKLYSSDD